MARGEGPRIVGLIGHPVAHSASPAMHQAAFRASGLNWVYALFDVLPEHLADAVRGIRALGLTGVNVTIPYKTAVVPLLDGVSVDAQRTGAVNTIVCGPAAGPRGEPGLWGDNTDVSGFRRAVQDAGVRLDATRVLVLGAGGAARAAVWACASAGAAWIGVAARRFDQARQLADELGPKVVPLRLEAEGVRDVLADVGLLVQATPAGMEGGPGGAELVEIAPPARLAADAVVFDMVYRPPVTPMVAASRAAGRRVVPGAAMLLHQGADAFELWTRRRAPREAMGEALARELGLGASVVPLASPVRRQDEPGRREGHRDA